MMFKSLLSRRQALWLFSGAPLVLVTSPALASAPYDVLTPELTEGPFYIDAEKIRRDITEGKPGAPLRLRILVKHVRSGAPIPDAAVDVWHCDARGVYSGFDSACLRRLQATTASRLPLRQRASVRSTIARPMIHSHSCEASS
jgi:protocatechuate 3,4-dioxygenase beta subunit